MGEVGEGDDETAKNDVRMKRRGGWCIRASPRAPSMLPCCTVVDEEEAGEVDADIEVEARCRQAVGDSNAISESGKT